MSDIELIRSKLSNFSTHVSGVTDGRGDRTTNLTAAADRTSGTDSTAAD